MLYYNKIVDGGEGNVESPQAIPAKEWELAFFLGHYAPQSTPFFHTQITPFI